MPQKTLIVGAGLTGLTAAIELQRAGHDVLVVEKGRGVGGRMAHRRIDSAGFDHGAQFITVRSTRFAAAIKRWEQAGLVQGWFTGSTRHKDPHVRYRGEPGMTAIAKALAKELEVRVSTRIVSVVRDGETWRATLEDGEALRADAVLLTAPVPQSLALLDAGQVELREELRTRLDRIDYEPCIAVMAVLKQSSRIPPPGAFAPKEGPIGWIADNQKKGVSTLPALTIHATPAFSREHWDADRQESGQVLLDAAEPWVGAQVEAYQVHGWRYSKPVETDADACLVLNHTPRLVIAGDAFAGPRVEGAALSGWAAAEALQ